MPLFVEIRTPENVLVRHALAGMATRADAFARDLVVQATVILAGTAILSFAGRAIHDSTANAFAVLLVFLVIWGYPVLFETLHDGRTPGKRSVGIRVVARDGSRVGFAASALRNLLRVVDFLPALYLAGIVSVFVTAEHRRIGDLAAGTIVIRDGDGPFPR